MGWGPLKFQGKNVGEVSHLNRWTHTQLAHEMREILLNTDIGAFLRSGFTKKDCCCWKKIVCPHFCTSSLRNLPSHQKNRGWPADLASGFLETVCAFYGSKTGILWKNKPFPFPHEGLGEICCCWGQQRQNLWITATPKLIQIAHKIRQTKLQCVLV